MESPDQRRQPARPAHTGPGTGAVAAALPPVRAAADSAGQIVGGQYVLKRKLGEGAVGEVWLARDRALGRDVALKRMRTGSADARVKDFVREARATATLNHPNIVTIFQVGRDSRQVFIAMEYVEGGSLSDELRTKGALEWRQATQAIRDAAAGLQAAHEAGMVHRDVKPSNLMRSSRGQIKVVDFGIARSGVDAEATQTMPGTLMGSPAYMAPEQCRGQSADARSDLYSLACAYYQLLTNELPFTGATMESVMFQHCSDPLPDAGGKVARLPEGVRRILKRGAEKKPEDRYQSATELLADLDAVLSSPEASHIFADPRLFVTRKSKETDRPTRIGSILRGKGIMGKTTWALVALTLAWLSFTAVRRSASPPPDGAPELAAAPAGIRPAPSLSTQAKAEQTIRNIFKDEFAEHTNAARLALAQKLLTQGQESNSDPAMRFVLLRDARDLAAAAGNTAIAFQAVDETAKGYAIDALDLKTAAFVTASVHMAPADDQHAFVEVGADLLDQAIASDHFTSAVRLGPVLELAAGKTKDIPLLSRVQARNHEMIALRREFERQKAAFDALRKNPADPDANLAVGSYLCFLKGNWETGLPMLGNGSDAALKALAKMELKSPADAPSQVGVADGWWDLGARQGDSAKAAIERHATGWYQKAFQGLSSAEQARVLARVPKDAVAMVKPPAPVVTPPPPVLAPPPATQPKIVAPTPAVGVAALADPPSHLDAKGDRVVDLMPLIDLQKAKESSFYQMQRNGAELSGCATIAVPYDPPQEYDYSIEMTITKPSRYDPEIIQILSHGGRQFNWCFYPDDPDRTAAGGFRGEPGLPENPLLTPKPIALSLEKRHTSMVRVRNDGVSAYVDGHLIMQYATNYADLGTSAFGRVYGGGLGIHLPRPLIYVIHKIEVVEINGRGHRVAPLPEDSNLVRSYSTKDPDPTWPMRWHVGFSADGKYLERAGVFASAWERENGKFAFQHEVGINQGGTFSRDGRFVFWANPYEHQGHVWDIGQQRDHVLNDLTGKFPIGDFSPDGSRLATSEPAIWDWLNAKRPELPRDEDNIEIVSYSPDKLHVLFSSRNARLCDATTLKTVWTQKRGVRFGRFSSDGARVILTHDDGVDILDAASGVVLSTWKNEDKNWNDEYIDARCSPDDHSILVFAHASRSFAAISLKTGKDLNRFPTDLPLVVSAEWSPDGKRVLAGCKDGFMRLLDFETGKVLQTFGGHVGPVWAVAFDKDGKFVASACNDEKVREFKVLVP